MKVIDEFTTTSLDNNNDTTTTSLDNNNDTTTTSLYSNSIIALKNNNSESIYERRLNKYKFINILFYFFLILVIVLAVVGFASKREAEFTHSIAFFFLLIIIPIMYGITTRYIHSLNIDYENLKKKREKKCDEGGKDGGGKPIWSVACKRANIVNQHFSNWDYIGFSSGEKKSDNSINKKKAGIIKFTRGLKDIELNDYNDNDEKYKNYKDPGNIFIIILNGIFLIIFLFTFLRYIIDYEKRIRILLGIVSVLFLFFNTFIPAKIINDYKMQKKTLGDQIILIKSKHEELKKGTTTSSIDNNDKNIKDTSLDNNIKKIENQLDTYKRDLPHFNIVKLAKMQITIGIVSVVYVALILKFNIQII